MRFKITRLVKYVLFLSMFVPQFYIIASEADFVFKADFDPKAYFNSSEFKTLEVQLTDKEQSDSSISWKQKDVSFAYRNEPVASIVKKIMIVSGGDKPIVGLELLNKKATTVSSMMRKVEAFKAVRRLLKCQGFNFFESADKYRVVKDNKKISSTCMFI